MMTPRWCAGLCLSAALAVGPITATDVAAQEALAVRGQDDREGADVLGAFTDSLRLLLIEHGTRIAFQDKTRRELGGNFWTDYRRSCGCQVNGKTPTRGT